MPQSRSKDKDGMPVSGHLRNKAIHNLEEAIEAFYGACIPLKEPELNIHKGKGYRDGWLVEIRVAGRRFVCHILINDSFPFSPPRFFIEDYKSLLNKIPHIGSDGLLCLGDTNYNYFSGRHSIRPLHRAAYNLLERGLSGQLNHDFQQEFLNYWCMEASDIDFCCIRKICSSRVSKIAYCIIRDKVYFFDNESTGRDWLKKIFPPQSGKSVAENTKFYPTVCLPIPNIWLPSEYPKSGKDILSLTKTYYPESVSLLLNCTPSSGENYLPVLFLFQTGSMTTFVATRICEPRTSRGPRKTLNTRSSKITVRKTSQIKEVGILFFSPSAKLRNMLVQRIDADWLYYRGEAGQSGRNKKLREAKIAILGCGSLGAQVADTLCKAGVGTLALFDPDALSWDNIYRHLLGPASIGKNKALALSIFLSQKFPESHILGIDSKWEHYLRKKSQPQLHQFDLIISLIGDDEDKTEQFLSLCTHQEYLFPPVIFGWTEVWGAAGHAVLLGNQPLDGCLLCKYKGKEQLNNIFIFDSNQFITLPECSTVFAPYGFIDTLPVVSIIVELAFDALLNEEVKNNYRIWVSNINRIKQYGGKISQWSLERFGNFNGEQVIRTNWIADGNCGACHANCVQGE